MLVSEVYRCLINIVITFALYSARQGYRSADTSASVEPHPRTKSVQRVFCFPDPAAWNSLLLCLCCIADTVVCKHKKCFFLDTVLYFPPDV